MCRGLNLGPHGTRDNAEGTVAGFGFPEGRERAGRTCARRAEVIADGQLGDAWRDARLRRELRAGGHHKLVPSAR